MKISKILVVAGAIAMAGTTASAKTSDYGRWFGGSTWEYKSSSDFGSRLFKNFEWPTGYDKWKKDPRKKIKEVHKKWKKDWKKHDKPDVVPLPASGLLLLGGLGALALRRRKS